jgi:hypothetical protein
LWAGVILFGIIGWLLIRYYRPAIDAPNDDEVEMSEWRLVRFLRYCRAAPPLYFGLRLFLASEWIESGIRKATNPRLTARRVGAAGVLGAQRGRTRPSGPAADRLPWLPFVHPVFMPDNHWYTWFANLINYGESGSPMIAKPSGTENPARISSPRFAALEPTV